MWISRRKWHEIQDHMYYQQKELEGLYKRVHQHEDELRWFRDHFKDLEDRVYHIHGELKARKILHG